jgi:hypothetical protein
VSSHIGNQPQEELTKFGYRSERKVEKFKNPAIFWRPANGTYQSIIWRFQDLNFIFFDFGAIFSQKSFV